MKIDFDQVIDWLYLDKNKSIQSLITEVAVHRRSVSFLLVDETVLGIHTGFYFETQKNTIMELIYCLNTKELVYQKATTVIVRKLGEIMRWSFTQDNGDDYMRFCPYITNKMGYSVFWWCPSYDVDKKIFSSFHEYPVDYYMNMNTLFTFRTINKCINIYPQSTVNTFRL